MALFTEQYEKMGVFNKRGNKAGIRCKIDTRVMNLGIQYLSKMGRSAYEQFILYNPAYPGYSTIQKYIAKVNILIKILI